MIPIRQSFIPATNSNRPGTIITPRYVTVHETANTDEGANAEMHRRYVSGSSQGGPEKTSYTLVVDDHEAIQLLPFNEASNHAGTSAGNKSGVSIELCVNSDGDWTKTQLNAADVIAWVYRSVPTLLPVDQGLVQHNYWIGKNCPTRLRQSGWGALVSRVKGLLINPTPDEDTLLERQYQANRAALGEKLYAALIDRPYFKGKVIVCEYGIVGPTTEVTRSIQFGEREDLETYFGEHGVLTRL